MPEVAAKEEGARLMCGARRLNGKIGFEKCRAGFPGAADSPEGESARGGRRVPTVPEVAVKEEGTRLARGVRRLNGKI